MWLLAYNKLVLTRDSYSDNSMFLGRGNALVTEICKTRSKLSMAGIAEPDRPGAQLLVPSLLGVDSLHRLCHYIAHGHPLAADPLERRADCSAINHDL